MSRAKRPWGVIAGPVILVVGLAGFWGVKSGLGMRGLVEDWSHQLEHSAEAVTMEMPNVPLIPPLYVNGDRIGRIETIVVERTQPGAVDSIRLVASVGDDHLARLDGCSLRVRLTSLDFGSYTRALQCVRNTDNLESFGRLAVEGADIELPIFVRVDDLPCTLAELHRGPCGEFSDDLRSELHDLREELRREARRVKVEIKRGR